MLDLLEQHRQADTDLVLESPEFTHEGTLPTWTGYVNEDENPPLEIKNVPEQTESFLLTVVHPEAAEVVNHTWEHWTVWDIPSDTQTIPRNWSPTQATEGYNDYLEQGWGGPSPPPESTEPYRFRVYALDDTLDVPPQTRRRRLASTIGLEEIDVVGAAELIGNYSATSGTVFTTEQGVSGLRPASD